jgi:prepilin-type N-terminal cleavage/methylation domain-containing protein
MNSNIPKFYHKKPSGFTLVELLIVIALLAIIAGVTFPFYSNILFRNSVDISNQAVSQSLRRAQLLSQSGESDSSWGIYLTSSTLTVFSGDTYATRTTSLDENHGLSDGLTITGDTEIVFEKFTGDLPTAKSITLELDTEQKTISLNTKGLVY